MSNHIDCLLFCIGAGLGVAIMIKNLHVIGSLSDPTSKPSWIRMGYYLPECRSSPNNKDPQSLRIFPSCFSSFVNNNNNEKEHSTQTAHQSQLSTRNVSVRTSPDITEG